MGVFAYSGIEKELKSDRFHDLISQRTSEGLTQKYNDLDENYTIAKEIVFYELMEPEDAGYFSEGSDICAGNNAPSVPELAGHELLLALMDTADKLYDNYAALIELARRQLRRCEQ